MLRFAIVLAFFALIPARADACSCQYPGSFKEALRRNPIMLRGVVLRAERGKEEILYTVRVIRVWKGPVLVGATIKIHSGYVCKIDLELKRKYVLAPSRDGARYAVGLCHYHSDAWPPGVGGE